MITIFADTDLQCKQAKKLIRPIRLISFKLFSYNDQYGQIIEEVRQNCSVSLLKYDQKSSMWTIRAAITCFNAGENAVRHAVELVRDRKSPPPGVQTLPSRVLSIIAALKHRVSSQV